MAYYDRYKQFRKDGKVELVPFVRIGEEVSDLHIIFDKEKMRLDNLSYKYYGDPDYAWLILQANPSLGGYEYSIKDGVRLRIPYPLNSALVRYDRGISAAMAHTSTVK